jgi:hypothetical protein
MVRKIALPDSDSDLSSLRMPFMDPETTDKV